MNNPIEAIFLDVGNTLRIVIEDKEFIAQAKKDLMILVGAKESEKIFFKTLETRWKIYRTQSKANLLEASEKELWTQWMLPDYPTELIAPLSGKLTRLWRDHDGRRVPRPDVKDVIIVAQGNHNQQLVKIVTVEGEDWVYLSGKWSARPDGDRPVSGVRTDADILAWRVVNNAVTKLYLAGGSYADTPNGSWNFSSPGSHYVANPSGISGY